MKYLQFLSIVLPTRKPESVNPRQSSNTEQERTENQNRERKTNPKREKQSISLSTQLKIYSGPIKNVDGSISKKIGCVFFSWFPFFLFPNKNIYIKKFEVVLQEFFISLQVVNFECLNGMKKYLSIWFENVKRRKVL